MKTKRLLAINFGGIGDEILFLPVLEHIKKASPECHITLLLEPRSKSVQAITNLIDEIKVFDIKKQPLLPGDYLNLCNILRSGNYQTVISSGGSPLVACLLFLSGIKQRIGYDSGFLSRFLLTKAVKLNKDQYAANMYHDLVQGLDLPAQEVVPEVKVSASNIKSMQELLSSYFGVGHDKATIVIHPGISRMAVKKGILKTWPAQNWAALIDKLLQNLQLKVILAGGPDDEEVIKEINYMLENKPQAGNGNNSLISVYGQTKSLADLAALISLSNLLICVDSAPMHVGVGLNKSLIAIFGPTDPSRLLPIRPNFKFLVNPNPDEILPVVENLLAKKTVR